jgi:hypothetical protein
MPHGLNQPNEFTLKGRQLEVAGSEGPVEVSEGANALVEDGAKPRA